MNPHPRRHKESDARRIWRESRLARAKIEAEKTTEKTTISQPTWKDTIDSKASDLDA